VRRIALAAALAVASLGALAGTASAAPVATLCGSVNVTVNGQPLVDQSTCQILPPAGS
jgi:type 1 fimbria pilin